MVGLRAMDGTLPDRQLCLCGGGLSVLAPVLSILGAMSWESIAKGSVLQEPLLAGLIDPWPAALGLAGTFALIGLSVLGIGLGLLAPAGLR